MYKPSINLCEHAFIVIWIATQEFASLFWKSALTCISWTQPRAASKRDETLLNPPEDNRSGRVWKWTHFPFGPQKQHKTIMKRVQQRFPLLSQGNPTPVSKFIPWQDSATGIHHLLSLPLVSDAARLENAEVWIRWSRDCTTENINVNIILGSAILQLKYSTTPFFFLPNQFFCSFFLLLFFHKSTYNKICTERS